MANLFNQNIRGTNNYKGILNLGSSIGTALPTTGNPMVYITDGDGVNLPIQVAQDKLRFDVNVGIGGDPSASYGLHVQSSSGTVLANRYHFTADRYLDASGVTFPTATNYTFAMGGVNQLIINNTNVVANNSIGFGTAGTPPSIGSYLTSGYSSNGEYMRLYSGHNAQYAFANYQFNVAARTFNNGTLLSGGTVASIIEVPNHTFSITNAGATNVNYRAISLAYTINNSVTAGGAASGLRIDASITNANGMLHRGFYYGVSGAGLTKGLSNTPLQRSGIVLQNTNTDASTTNLNNQNLAPSIELLNNTFSGGSSVTTGWRIQTSYTNANNHNLLFQQTTNLGSYTTILQLDSDGSVISNAAMIASGGFRLSAANTAASISFTTDNANLYNANFTYAAPGGLSRNFRAININYIINNGASTTGTGTGIFLNATETALNGMTHRLIDLQVGGVSRFRVNNNGTILTNLQTGNAGLSTGELYKDTAANILSNGDFVVGMKA